MSEKPATCNGKRVFSFHHIPLLSIDIHIKKRVQSFFNVCSPFAPTFSLDLRDDPQQAPPPPRAGSQLPVLEKQSSPEAPQQHEILDDGWPGLDNNCSANFQAGR